MIKRREFTLILIEYANILGGNSIKFSFSGIHHKKWMKIQKNDIKN